MAIPSGSNMFYRNQDTNKASGVHVSIFLLQDFTLTYSTLLWHTEKQKQAYWGLRIICTDSCCHPIL